MKSFIYKFISYDGDIIYIGKTNDIKKRMKQHFGPYPHLPKECYEQVEKILFGSDEEGEDSDGDEPEDEDETPTKSADSDDDDDEPEEKPKKDNNSGCPYGHKFGKDCDNFDECEDCTCWDKCCKAYKANK